MENMLSFSRLKILDLAHNLITEVEGLENCRQLMTLNLSFNKIRNIVDCEQLKELPKLNHLDLRSNFIEDADNVVPFVGDLPAVHTLFLNNNPCLNMIRHSRRKLIVANKTLFILNDKEVSEIERERVEAFAEGG